MEAHKELAGAFKQCFSGPEWCRRRLYEGNYFNGHSKRDAAFLQDTSITGVPDELRRLIHGAIRRVPKRETITIELKEAFAEAPTLHELTEAIRRAKTNSSAGMNGVIYNMLKKLLGELIAKIH